LSDAILDASGNIFPGPVIFVSAALAALSEVYKTIAPALPFFRVLGALEKGI
jgi:hypothetical protein